MDSMRLSSSVRFLQRQVQCSMVGKRQMKKQQTTAPTMFIMREMGMKGLRMLMMVAKMMNAMLKYLKWWSCTLSVNSSISRVRLTSRVHGKTVILPKRQETSTTSTAHSWRQQFTNVSLHSGSLFPEIARPPKIPISSQSRNPSMQESPRSLSFLVWSLFYFTKVITIVWIVKANAHVPARFPTSPETQVMLSRSIWPLARAMKNLTTTKRKQIMAEQEPYSESLTRICNFLIKMSASRGRRRTSESHWVLNWSKAKASLWAMESGLPVLSKMRQMTEQSWSTIKSMQMTQSRMRQKPVMKRKRFSHLLPSSRRMVHSTSLSSLDMWITQMRQVMNEMSPETTRMMEPLTIPVVLKSSGMVSMAPPTMELNMASTVVLEGLTRSASSSFIMIKLMARLMPNIKERKICYFRELAVEYMGQQGCVLRQNMNISLLLIAEVS